MRARFSNIYYTCKICLILCNYMLGCKEYPYRQRIYKKTKRLLTGALVCYFNCLKIGLCRIGRRNRSSLKFCPGRFL